MRKNCSKNEKKEETSVIGEEARRKEPTSVDC
jgi:hypothetical protein